MCVPDACPCNARVNPANFGDRESELDGLETYEGLADMFYEDCYKNLVESGTVQPLGDANLQLMLELERDYDCQGLCETGLFYFY